MRTNRTEGFTLIEILVAMVVLAVGLLGMAAMTTWVIGSSTGARDQTSATNICQLKMEELKDADWSLLGTRTNSDTDKATFGLTSAGIIQERDLNSQGKTLAQTADPNLGPYKYVRNFVICKGVDLIAGTPPDFPSDYFPQVVPGPGEPPQKYDCSVDAASTTTPNPTRVEWLSCNSGDITSPPAADNPEKKIKVLCTWRSKNGDCHSVHFETAVVKLGS